MNEIDLAAYGFGGRWEALAEETPELLPGRVLSQEKGLYRVVTAAGERGAGVSGKYRHQALIPADYPAVGDFVMLCAGEGAPIQRLLPRQSVFIRRAAGTKKSEEQVVAANIDTAFLCMALNSDFNLRRLERYLSLSWESGATPVVVLTKADLCPALAQRRRAVEEIALGADVLTTAALEGDGLDMLQPYLRAGKTVALLGSSGVGKSTLINRLLGEDRLATNGLRSDDKGRHTTTRRELFLLPGGGIVIDTPGMRELGIWEAAQGVDKTFADIEALAARCRFGDCTHSREPGCAVRAALESGALEPGRWQSWLKLRGEAAYTASQADYLAAKEQKFRAIAQYNKANRKR